MLIVDQCRFRYPAQKKQNHFEMNFSLEVNAGEILSVVGPSGSGKTTLLNLIAGFSKPESGRILIDGTEISQLEISKRPVTTVFQENNLFPHLDAFTNIALGIKPSLKLSNEEKKRIDNALDDVGLTGLSSRMPKQLSGGQRQRVAIARALVRKHSILLLDEPLAALGPALRDEILELLKKLVDKENMSALLISHQPEDAIRASKRTAFIHQGKVLALGESSEILSRSGIPEINEYLGNKF